MAELKRNFSDPKMNKDMDERILPSGQYRDALNVQISTSEGSDVGTLQTLLGNKELSTDIVPDDYCTCVGAHAVAEKDLIYYFVSGGGQKGYRPFIRKDYIIEYNTVKNSFRYVFVDIYSIQEAQVGNDNTNKYFTISDNGDSTNTTSVRVGMHITGTFTNHASGATLTLSTQDNVLVTNLVKVSGGWKVYYDYQWDNGSGGSVIPITGAESIYFVSEFSARILNFNPNNKINNINHLDGMLFWTDGVTEPKKIHIERCLKGTGGTLAVVGWDDAQLGNHVNNTGNAFAKDIPIPYGTNANFHTRVTVESISQLGYQTCLDRTNVRPMWTTEENITVIKKSPKFPLEIKMLETTLARVPQSTTANPQPASNAVSAGSANSSGAPITIDWADANGDLLVVGDVVGGDTTANGFYFDTPVDFRVSDVLLFTNDMSLSPDSFDENEADVRVVVRYAPNGMPDNGGLIGPYEFEIISIDEGTPTVSERWIARLDSPPSLFEFKFPRFSYRWKYTDGEYSCFAPWSNVAFIPGAFDYLPKKGYNLGMTNRLRSLRLQNYFPEYHLVPDDVVQVDLLYKEDGKNEIYTVKEITRKDGHPQWPDTAATPYNRGKYDLTSEMIHAILPSNQLLRPWDNVPKSALTQEITSNRLIYGNYKQNYDLAHDLKLDVTWEHVNNPGQVQPEKSCKTLRTYQLGVVFLDNQGRETPVQIPTKSSSIYLDKKWSTFTNKLKGRIHPDSTIPSWAEYFKFYIKETSNEYYNFAMDRWYNAEDGNVWISLPSSERNKIQDDTFLILKQAHDSSEPVYEKARYKVIAISPDAPLFVKTQKKIHGNVQTNLQTTAAANAFPTANEILIAGGDFTTAFGTTWMADEYSKISRGSLQVRLTGTLTTNSIATEWVSIASIRVVSGVYVIRLQGPFGDVANMNFDATTNPGGLGDGSSTFPTYRIELRENVVEDKAEFDGRFFVKIFRDNVLEKYILGADADAATRTFNIISSHPTRLIAGIGPDNDHRHPSVATPGTTTAGAVHTFNRTNCEWYGSETSSPGTSGSSYGQVNVVGNSIPFDSSEQMGHSNAKYRTQDYWQNMPAHAEWFIDACGHAGGDVTWTSGSGFHANSNSDDNGVDSTHSDINGTGRGGIRHYSDHTRIYWGIRRHGSSSTDLESQNAADFYSAMRSTGTLFRWRNDPDQTVYRVLDSIGHRNAANYQHESNSYPGSKKRRQMVQRIVVDATSLPMDPVNWDPMSACRHDGYSSTIIDIVTPDVTFGMDSSELSSEEPAIFETEPKESVDVDIYFEASGAIPLEVTHRNNELLIPYFSTMNLRTGNQGTWHTDANGAIQEYTVTAVNQPSDPDLTKLTISPALVDTLAHDTWVRIKRYDGSWTTLYVSHPSANYAVGNTVISFTTGPFPSNKQTPFGYEPWRSPKHQQQVLGWFNCWQFGNGIESDRIRDDYNAPRLANGVKASTVMAEPYAEEHRSSGMIWSGIFNSTSGVNNLNQFIQAEPITKDLSPRHGSLQKLVSRDTDTMAFCEDKVLRMLTNKDALYNADGNTNVTASNAVIGQATPINGDYGISTNPESLAVTPFGMYWADQMRGQVLSLEGGMSISSISDIGMKDYFNDNLENISELIGTYDEKKNEYNLTFAKRVWESQLRPSTTTVSYNELTKGWVSFKSFGPEVGISLNNQYYTFKEGSIWKHHSNLLTNNFYGTQYYSDVTLIFNDQPSSVKSFNTINYEGTQARISSFVTESVTNASNQTFNITDGKYHNLTARDGWFVDSMLTDLQEVDDVEFKNKEGKWFGTVQGVTTQLSNLDEREFSVQGLGNANCSTTGTPAKRYDIEVHAHPTNAAGNVNWDSSGADVDFKIGSYSTHAAIAGSIVVASTASGGVTSSSYIDNLVYNSTTGLYVYSGLDLDAADFEVEGGAATTSGSGNSTVYIYTAAANWKADTTFSSGNTVSTGITKVEFRNQGIAGDPGNVVEARAYYAQFTMPSSQYNLHFDVDLKTERTHSGNVDRLACVHVSYDEHAADLVTVTPSSPITGITRTDDVAFLTGNPTTKSSDKWSGTVLEGAASKIAEYTIEADSGYHLQVLANGSGTQVHWFNRMANSAWVSYYTWNVTDVYYTSSGNTGLIEKCIIEIFYTPPVGVSGLDPDPVSPEGNFCAHLHDIRLIYKSSPIVTTGSLGKRITSITVPNHIVAPASTVTPCYASSGLVWPTDPSGFYYTMVVKLNADQDGITHAYRWDNQTWVATTDLTGNTGPHGIGHYFAAGQMAATQGNSVNNYRLATQNHIQVNSGNAYLSFSMPTDASGYAPGVYCTFLEAGDFTGAGVGNMTLANGVPTNINTLIGSSWEVVANITPTLTNSTLSNITKGGSTITMASQPAMLKLREGADYNFSFTYTRTGSNTLSLLRQPLLSDFTGFDNNYITAGNAGSYATGTTVHIADTTGIKVGMYVEDVNFSSGESSTNPINPRTTVTSVTTNDSIVLSAAPIAPGIPAGSSLRIYSDWEYELKSATAFGSKTGNVVVTVSGIFTIKQYGSSVPDGNVVLQAGNFITNVTP